MTRLFIGSAFDAPHIEHPYVPASSACGRALREMRVITETQALVWLGNRRCKRCAQAAERIARGNR